jgi:hypothetical protein
MKRTSAGYLSPLLAGVVLSLVLTGQAAAERLYDVEVIIFTNPAGGNDGEQMSTPAANAVRPSGVFPEGRFTELSTQFYTLDNIRGGLAAAPGYSVLFHRAWRQLAYDRSSAIDYPVHSFADNGRDSVEGTVTLIVERYLHLDLDLLLMKAGSSRPVLYSDGPGSVPAYRLSEKRRVRSSELHYFDHPQFGVIARITPYVAPEQPPVSQTDLEIIPEATEPPAAEAPAVTPDDRLTR